MADLVKRSKTDRQLHCEENRLAKIFGRVNRSEDRSRPPITPVIRHQSRICLYLGPPVPGLEASRRRVEVKAVARAREYGVGFPYDLDSLISTVRSRFGIILR